MWENWLTNSLYYYAEKEKDNYNSKEVLIPIGDLKIRKINLFVDIMSGMYKQAILLGKWCYCFKELNNKKINFLEQVIISQNKVFSFFDYKDGFSEVSKIVDVFLIGHKYYLYDYFGRDAEWDNEILCNAVLRYFPFKFRSNGEKRKRKVTETEFYKYKQMYTDLSYSVNFNFSREIRENKMPEEKKFIDFSIKITQDFMSKFDIEGIILFVKYMQNWRQYFLSKKEDNGTGSGNLEDVEYNDSLDNTYDDDLAILDNEKYYPNYDLLNDEEEQNDYLFEVVDNEKFWRKIQSLLEPIENRIIKFKFIYNFSFEKISQILFLDKEMCYFYYQKALDKIRMWLLTNDTSDYVIKR